MENILKYDITIKDEGTYECKLEPAEDGIIAYIFTPANKYNWQKLFIENIVNTNNEWVFTNRTLPIDILNLEKELSSFINNNLA